VATFLVLGGLLAIGAIILTTVLDRTIRTPDDVKRLGLHVLAVVPDGGSSKSRRRSRKAAKKDSTGVHDDVPPLEGARRTMAMTGAVPEWTPGRPVAAAHQASAAETGPGFDAPSAPVAHLDSTRTAASAATGGGRRRGITLRPSSGRATSRDRHHMNLADDSDHRWAAGSDRHFPTGGTR
jgi:hypothetical protein